jgi:hypothetical protein
MRNSTSFLALAGITLFWLSTAQAVTINAGATLLKDPAVQLNLTLPANCYQVQIQNESESPVVFTSPAAAMPWTLSTGDGQKTVNVTFYYTYQYQCGSHQCGSYICGSYRCGFSTCYNYCPTYCPDYCTGYGTSSETVYATLDQTQPLLTLVTLADSSHTYNPSLSVTGTTSDLNGISELFVSGTSFGGWGAGVPWPFGTTLQLNAGSNLITVVSTDNAGNSNTVTRTIFYDPPVNGMCGLSDKQTFTAAPATELCKDGTPTNVEGNGPWTWSCNGANTGTTADCTAIIKTYMVSFASSLNGGLDASTPSPATVNHGSTTSFKFNADSGYYVSGSSGCGGNAYTNSDQSISSHTYTTGAITGACSVNATFTLKSSVGPTFSSASYYGGTGDEHGTGIAILNRVLFASGYASNGGILARYSLPPGSTPAWSVVWPNLGANDSFNGVAVTSTNVYTAGMNQNRTVDSMGGKEVKGLVAKFLLTGATGAGYGGAVWDVQTPAAPGAFPYGGGELLNAILNTVEATTDFVYATGNGQVNGSNGGRLYLSKLNAAGTVLWTVNDSAEMVGAYSSRGSGLAALNNYIYVAGANYDSGSSKPYLRKYDQSGALVWTRKSALSGSYQGVTSFGGALYAVGQTGAPDFLIEKWDEAGNVLWTKQYDRNSAEDTLNGVTGLGSSVYAAGSTKGSTAGGSDAALLQINPATGDLLSTTLWGGAQDDSATGIATDGQDLYLIGNTASFGAGGVDMVLLRYAVQTAPTSKVLVAGGMSSNSAAPPTAEVFHQTTGTWSSTSNTIAFGTIPTNGICGANMTLLGSGKALIAGGGCGGDNGTTTNATSLYDPATNLWSTGAPMGYGRNNFGLVTLASGDALAFAGCSGGCSGPNVLGQSFYTVGGTAQRYSTTDNSWTTKQSLNTRRAGLGNQNTKTVTLQDGKILVCGGNDAFSTTYTSCEIYDPTADTWTPTAGSYPELYGPTALVLLNNGKVLSAFNYSAGAVLFDPVTRTWSATGAPVSVQNSAHLVRLTDGRVLMTGGYANNAGTYSTLATAQTYDPTSGTWAATGSLGIARYLHFTVLLEDGKVLAGGGVTGSTTSSWGPPVASAEIFDSATGVWSATGSMTQARWNSVNVVRLPTIDATAPVVTFTLPANSSGTTVSITTLTATDNVSVTGYCLSETDSSSDCSWSGVAPSTYTFATEGIKTLFAFAKDAAGNISSSVSATVDIQTDKLLTISKPGSGTGTVTSSPAGINCGTTCSSTFPFGSVVVLFQSTTNSSGFSAWGGGVCSGTGDCAFSMSSDRSVSADFSLSPLVKNLRTGIAYNLLQTACSEASGDDTIRILSTLPAAGLNLDTAINLTIEGGFDPTYSACIGLTPIFGPVKITTGTIRVNGLVIRPPP